MVMSELQTTVVLRAICYVAVPVTHLTHVYRLLCSVLARALSVGRDTHFTGECHPPERRAHSSCSGNPCGSREGTGSASAPPANATEEPLRSLAITPQVRGKQTIPMQTRMRAKKGLLYEEQTECSVVAGAALSRTRRLPPAPLYTGEKKATSCSLGGVIILSLDTSRQTQGRIYFFGIATNTSSRRPRRQLARLRFTNRIQRVEEAGEGVCVCVCVCTCV